MDWRVISKENVTTEKPARGLGTVQAAEAFGMGRPGLVSSGKQGLSGIGIEGIQRGLRAVLGPGMALLGLRLKSVNVRRTVTSELITSDAIITQLL